MQANEWKTSAFKKWSIILLSNFLYLFPVMLLIPSRLSWLTFLVIRVHVMSLPNKLFLVVVHRWAEVMELWTTCVNKRFPKLRNSATVDSQWMIFSFLQRSNLKKWNCIVKYVSSETHEGRVTKPLVMICLLIEWRMQHRAMCSQKVTLFPPPI